MPRAVVIESDSAEQKRLVSILKSCGFLVVGRFNEAKGAVEKILELKPDVVLLNVFIGDMDGLTVGRRLRDEDKDIKLIFIAEDGRYAVEAYNVGATDFLLKPIRKERLKRALKRIE